MAGAAGHPHRRPAAGAGGSGDVRLPGPHRRHGRRAARCRLLPAPRQRAGLDAVHHGHRAADPGRPAQPAGQPGHRAGPEQPLALADAQLRGAAEPEFLPERFRRQRCQPGDADRYVAARIGRADGRFAVVHRGLHRHRAVPVRAGRLAPDGAADPVAAGLCGDPGVLRAAREATCMDRLGGAFQGDGPHRRWLHQHPDAEAVRPWWPRAGLRSRVDPGTCGQAPRTDPHHHRHGPDHRHRQRLPDRRHLRPGAVAVEWRTHHRGRDHPGHRPGHPHPQHVRLDHVDHQRHLRGHRHGAGWHHHHRPAADRAGPRGRRAAAGGPRRRALPGHPLPLRQEGRGDRRPGPGGEARREDRPGRSVRRRQVDPGQHPAAPVRPGKRPHPDRWAGHRPRHPGEPAPADRRGHPGHLAAAPFDPRQPAVWPSRRQRRAAACGRGQGACRGLHRHAGGRAGASWL